MRYCRRCILPDTRPFLSLDEEGICNACRTHEHRPAMDWDARRAQFLDVVKNAKANSRGYDCLIPVSGGKDSHWQVLLCLEHGLNPLTLSWRPPARTAIGQRNLDNLKALGVDHVDVSVDPTVERRFMLATFEKFGTPAVPMHLAILHLPLTYAVRFNIPLIVFGENAAFEYGSADEAHQGFALNEEWIRTYGVTHGTTAVDWVGTAGLCAQDLLPYTGPTPRELEASGVLAVFLGYYFPWDPETSLQAAEAHGFARSSEGPKTGYYDYADIDDDFIAIHHYGKWLKFGFTRLFDNLSLEIRNGRLTRDEALAVLKRMGDQRPDEDITAFCRFTGITKQHFDATLETFRNHDIWFQEDGVWKIRDFLVDDWSWT